LEEPKSGLWTPTNGSKTKKSALQNTGILWYNKQKPKNMEYNIQELEKQAGLEIKKEDPPLGYSVPKSHANLKRINKRHEMMILLFVNGMKPREIAQTLGMNLHYVWMVLRDPLVTKAINEIYKQMDDEFKALYSKVINSIRDRLESKDPDIQAKAVDQYLKAHGKYNPKENPNDNATAEDVVKKILELRIVETRPANQPQEANDQCQRTSIGAAKQVVGSLQLPAPASAGT